MTLGEVLSTIQSEYSKGVHAQTTRLADKFIYQHLLSVRGKLLYQAADKNQSFSDWDFQTISCLELQETELSDCPECVPTGCKVYKSLQDFPIIISGSMRPIIKAVTSVDGSTVYDMTSWAAIKNKKHNRYTSSLDEFFIHNNRLYLTGTKGGLNRRISVTALFYDPTEAYLYPGCSDDTCRDIFEMEFPANGKFLDSIMLMTIEKLKNLFVQTKEDKVNNLTDV